MPRHRERKKGWAIRRGTRSPSSSSSRRWLRRGTRPLVRRRQRLPPSLRQHRTSSRRRPRLGRPSSHSPPRRTRPTPRHRRTSPRLARTLLGALRSRPRRRRGPSPCQAEYRESERRRRDSFAMSCVSPRGGSGAPPHVERRRPRAPSVGGGGGTNGALFSEEKVGARTGDKAFDEPSRRRAKRKSPAETAGLSH